MRPFTRLQSPAFALPAQDIDTDVIFPARFLLITAKEGLGRYAFYEWRYDGEGEPRPAFPLNTAAAEPREILIAGANFGCGSSREQAVWALADLGLRCIISSSFGEIFYSNCFKSGLLPIVVSPDILINLQARALGGQSLIVDLDRQCIEAQDGALVAFEIDAWRRQALMNGWDEVTTILRTSSSAIDGFEIAQRRSAPWLYTDN
jgi:3-isopropylmalate/(R)-2-methylmalate dehydratase small subunit